VSLPDAPAEQHRAVCARFTELARRVPDWDAPAPVEGWTARDVVGHLVEWFPAFVRDGGGPAWAAGPPVTEDPVAAWVAQAEGVQALLDDPETAAAPFAHPRLPPSPLGPAVAQYYTADVFLHSWDLARASGQEPDLDPDTCAAMLAGMEPIEELLRGSGQYGAAVPVPAGASPQDRLVGFIGRDPGWRPS
jgi:uncharacterized protein (TIGR03086 family)